MTPTLRTRQLLLRRPEKGDAEAYVRFYGDAEASHFSGGPMRPDQAFGMLCRDIGHWLLQGFGKFALDAEGRTVGVCGIVHLDGWPSHELTWWLLPEERGKGYAQEASHEVLAWAGEALRMPQVETHFRDENTAAARLVQGLGGRKLRRDRFPDGAERDVYGFATQGGHA